MFVNKEDFYNTLTEKNSVLSYYDKLYNNFINTNDAIYTSENEKSVILDKKVTSIRLFPSYFKPVFKKEDGLNIKELPQKNINGYAIIIKEKQSIDDFLKNEYSKSFRANIKRLSNRFETCFNVKYDMFFGDIDMDKYQFLMNTLHSMLITRFEERNDKNEILENWSFYLESTFDLIKTNKASIFVIYNGDIPVHICVNHHFNNIFFVSIPSYDIDYAKFALGNISIFKLLEYAIQNNYNLLDMAYGDLEYKRRWSNLIYSFSHHIIYPKNNILSNFKAHLEIGVILFKNFLKKYKVDAFVKKIKQLKSVKNKTNENTNYKIQELSNLDTTSLIEVNISGDYKIPIRKLVFESLFTQKENINNISVYKNSTEDKFYVVGKTIKLQINIYKTINLNK